MSFDSIFDDLLSSQCVDCEQSVNNDDIFLTGDDNDAVCTNCIDNYTLCDWTEVYYHCDDLTITGYIDTWNIPQLARDRHRLSSNYGTYRLMVCQTALSAEFFSCYDCDEYHLFCSSQETDNGNTICQQCYERNYFTCDDCDRVLESDDYHSDGVCDRCYREDEDNDNEDDEDDDEDTQTSNTSPIHSYSTNPLNFLKFKGDPKDGVYFGVELEVESPYNNCTDHAIVCAAKLRDHAILKYDGTLSNGFEIVSCPSTLEIHKNVFSEFLDVKPDTLRSYESGRCGMHIHISRKPLSKLTEGKILVLVNCKHNADFIKTIAGRLNNRYCVVDATKKITDCLGDCYTKNRYEAVNLVNANTIELRIFRGTLHKVHFLANLEFTHALVYYCQDASIQALDYETFMQWIKKSPKIYSNLIEFMTGKGY